MQNDKERVDLLSSILAGLEIEYSLLKTELHYEEKINRYLHDQGKKLRQDLFLTKKTPDIQNKGYLLESITKNHRRIKQLEDALQDKKQLQSALEVVSRKVSKSIPSKLEKNMEIMTNQRDKAHTKHLNFESQRNRSLQRVKKAITDQQAMSVMNQSLTSFKSASSLSLSTASKATSSTVTSKNTKFKVVSKSRKEDRSEEKPPEQQFDFKKKVEPTYPKLKLFQYEPLPKNS
jgi:hypothetical protein